METLDGFNFTIKECFVLPLFFNHYLFYLVGVRAPEAFEIVLKLQYVQVQYCWSRGSFVGVKLWHHIDLYMKNCDAIETL